MTYNFSYGTSRQIPCRNLVIGGPQNGRQHRNSRSFDVTVNNVPPQITLNTRRIGHTDLFFASGLYKDPGSDLLSATVDYGDGSGAHQVRLRHGRFLFAHRYRHSGNFNMTVTIQDDDGGVTNINRVVSV
jgi:hypothetical protein